jgi:hypothetical protein
VWRAPSPQGGNGKPFPVKAQSMRGREGETCNIKMKEVDKSRLIRGRKEEWREKGKVVVRVVGGGRAPLGPRRWDQTLPFSGVGRFPREVHPPERSSWWSN